MLGNGHDFQFSKMVKVLVEGCSLEWFMIWRYFYRGAWGDSRNKGGSSAWGPGGNPSQTLHHARRRTAGLQSCPQIQSVSQIHPLSALVDISVKSFIEQSQSSGAKKTDWVGLILCFNSEAVGLHSMGFFLTPEMILRRRDEIINVLRTLIKIYPQKSRNKRNFDENLWFHNACPLAFKSIYILFRSKWNNKIYTSQEIMIFYT